MKDQYFGDINDYRKYGILRAFQSAELPVGVHWMLTPDDNARDGRKLGYLDQPSRWRHYDPELFDHLHIAVSSGSRAVSTIETAGVLSSCRFYREHTPDCGFGRQSHFRRGLDCMAGLPVIFFDPDNGVEVPSTPIHRKGSSKFVFWSELLTAWEAGHSLLVYQHYPRVSRHQFEQALGSAVMTRLGARPRLLRTGNVVFVVVPQPLHREQVTSALTNLQQRWRGEIDVLP